MIVARARKLARGALFMPVRTLTSLHVPTAEHNPRALPSTTLLLPHVARAAPTQAFISSARARVSGRQSSPSDPWDGMWRAPQAVVIPNIHLPMRSLEVKNRTSVEDIKGLKLITAIKTPYLPDGRFDLEAYDTLMHMQIVNGAEGVIVGGTTGEGHLMSWDEHIMLIGHTVNCFGTSIKVIGNTGSNSTREAIHATEQGFAVGMHAALHINPYYGKTSLQGMIFHFETVLSMGPTIIYNVPSRTGQDIPPTVIHKISENPNMAGVKECIGNNRIKEYVDRGIVIWSGNDDECHDSRWSYGAAGVISVTSNLVPGLMHELMFHGMNPSLNSRLMPLISWLFCEPNPIGLNTALAQLGVIRPVFRLPYVPLPLAKRIEFVSIVEAIGREHFVGEKDLEVLNDGDFLLVGRY
ncbi:4-hydroxy-tetrahydrodipicolinate synthase 2, chloroplastic [Apostasia shenzhenica]|uniref:4-hydroxy-tetrahydrodipicolinate synthase n=1 Tax=Apostasia shenzhenica TaxID=1088818 RepID=A0A2I0B1E6_9ASPA|nr:4-hydroxy-tetrahydrodipicolinate synthase 2, chloroplastic [Apostasia shenzhenica]